MVSMALVGVVDIGGEMRKLLKIPASFVLGISLKCPVSPDHGTVRNYGFYHYLVNPAPRSVEE